MTCFFFCNQEKQSNILNKTTNVSLSKTTKRSISIIFTLTLFSVKFVFLISCIIKGTKWTLSSMYSLPIILQKIFFLHISCCNNSCFILCNYRKTCFCITIRRLQELSGVFYDVAIDQVLLRGSILLLTSENVLVFMCRRLRSFRKNL